MAAAEIIHRPIFSATFLSPQWPLIWSSHCWQQSETLSLCDPYRKAFSTVVPHVHECTCYGKSVLYTTNLVTNMSFEFYYKQINSSFTVKDEWYSWPLALSWDEGWRQQNHEAVKHESGEHNKSYLFHSTSSLILTTHPQNTCSLFHNNTKHSTIRFLL